MARFLVQFRLRGYAKEYAREVIYSVARKFGVKRIRVPHITLYGPATTGDIKKVISAVEKMGRRYTLVPFKIRGFSFFDKPAKVIYFDINPSQELEELRWELSQELRKVSIGKSKDSRGNFAFHTTIAFRDIDAKFKQIWSYLKNKEEPNINQYLLRITVLGARGRIACEYDLILKKLLSREEALSKYWWRKTISRLGELQGLPLEKPVSLMEWLKKVFGFG